MKRVVLTFYFIFAFTINYAQIHEQIIQRGNSYYLANSIVIKIKNQLLPVCDSETLLEHLNQKLNQQIIENISIPLSFSKKLLKGTSSLDKIFYLTTGQKYNSLEIIKKLSTFPEIEWAEPRYIRKVCYDPNDKLYVSGNQPYLNVIKAKEAWDVSKGCKEIIIGIIDTGVDIDHPDLAANIFQNKNEIPSNGIDDDDSGEYIDDINGWDFGGLSGTPDNNPREDESNTNGYHGTHVAGIASAVSDNLFGISSIGFNCTILPVKVSQDGYRDENDKPRIIFGFEGIKYAVDKGAKIINCSWGGYEYSKYEQEIIDYAVANGVLVIAAAGNDNSNKPFYPASYRGVLSVGWTDDDDTKSTASNYGEFVDVMAPGTSIYSTWPSISGFNPPFNHAGGSSMAAPLVAGLAGLVISTYPNLTVEQLIERIRTTCDNISQKNLPQYNNLLGSGRINAFKAVSKNETHSLRATKVKYQDRVHHTLQLEDTTNIEITFTNYLMPLNNVSITITSDEPFIKMVRQSITAGFLQELGTITDHFLFTLTNDIPQDTTIYFLVKYNSPVYTDFEWIPVRINQIYRTHENGKIIATVTNNGSLGFCDFNANVKGEGFKYMGGGNLIYEGALLYGTSSNSLMDGARVKDKPNNDFKVVKSISLRKDNSMTEIYSLINNNNNSELGILTHIYSYSFNSSPDDSYIILHFILENTLQIEIQNLFLGYLLDWNLSPIDYTSEIASFDSTDKFAFVYNKKMNGPVVGTALLSEQRLGYMGINNHWRIGEVIFEDGFDNEEKWYSISNGIVNISTEGDVSYVLSGGPVNIMPKEKEMFTFVIAAASTKEDLRQVIRTSRNKYNSFICDIYKNDNSLPENIRLYQNYPNPFNPSTVISYRLPFACKVSLKVFDLLGREVATLVDEFQQAGDHNSRFSTLNSQFSSGIYFYRISTGNPSGQSGQGFIQSKKMILIK